MRNVGQRNGRARLIEAEVEAIRRSALPQSWLAKKYNVSQPTISEILSGKKWKHLEDHVKK